MADSQFKLDHCFQSSVETVSEDDEIDNGRDQQSPLCIDTTTDMEQVKKQIKILSIKADEAKKFADEKEAQMVLKQQKVQGLMRLQKELADEPSIRKCDWIKTRKDMDKAISEYCTATAFTTCALEKSCYNILEFRDWMCKWKMLQENPDNIEKRPKSSILKEKKGARKENGKINYI